MSPNEEIERLDAALKSFAEKYPATYGTLSITNTTFRACDKQRWMAHNWDLTDAEIHGILNGNDSERRAALLSLLRRHNIDSVEIVPGVDIIVMGPHENT
jgi:hypothetical protein